MWIIEYGWQQTRNRNRSTHCYIHTLQFQSTQRRAIHTNAKKNVYQVYIMSAEISRPINTPALVFDVLQLIINALPICP